MEELLVRTQRVVVIVTTLTILNTVLHLIGEAHVLEGPPWTASIVGWAVVVLLKTRFLALEAELASREQMREKIMEDVVGLLGHVEKRLSEYEQRAFARVLGNSGGPDEGPCLRSTDRRH